eukprot:CAMPEP_0182861594 /NCGR_PEP_ID=MMETSP0034_2-20130328/5581_1 /TAXON_ID=156128 /ORGANISM="Nephroselmis pyriformis, Strain CCMP717" /LENGTH=585 /DNA_ID=CAMNT_0024993547 /DNA_START=47 /DNA_END=1804 /DNA_ORIENTATION=-
MSDIVEYTVVVRTADKTLAGGTSDYVTMWAKGNESDPYELMTIKDKATGGPSGNFNRGVTATLKYKGPNMDPKYVRVKREGTAFEINGWLVDDVSITNDSTGKEAYFPVFRPLNIDGVHQLLTLDSMTPVEVANVKKNPSLPDDRRALVDSIGATGPTARASYDNNDTPRAEPAAASPAKSPVKSPSKGAVPKPGTPEWGEYLGGMGAAGVAATLAPLPSSDLNKTVSSSGLTGMDFDKVAGAFDEKTLPKLASREFAMVVPKLPTSTVYNLPEPLLSTAAPHLTKAQLTRAAPKLGRSSLDDMAAPRFETVLPKLTPPQLAEMSADGSNLLPNVPSMTKEQTRGLTVPQLNATLPKMSSPDLATTVPKLSSKQLGGINAPAFDAAVPHISASQASSTSRNLSPVQVGALGAPALAAALPLINAKQAERVLPKLSVPELATMSQPALTGAHADGKLSAPQVDGLVDLGKLPRPGAPTVATRAFKAPAPKKEMPDLTKPLKVVAIALLALLGAKLAGDALRKAPKGWKKDSKTGKWMYTVVRGDTLSHISNKFGKDSWEKIADQNAAVVSDPSLIFPGQKLYVNRF